MLAIGNDQAMGSIEHGKVCDVSCPTSYTQHFDGPACGAIDLRRILRHGPSDGGPVIGAIAGPELGLWLKPFAEPCCGF
eukprot:1976652-Alexandrium_andersonii.AAC.1